MDTFIELSSNNGKGLLAVHIGTIRLGPCFSDDVRIHYHSAFLNTPVVAATGHSECTPGGETSNDVDTVVCVGEPCCITIEGTEVYVKMMNCNGEMTHVPEIDGSGYANTTDDSNAFLPTVVFHPGHRVLDDLIHSVI